MKLVFFGTPDFAVTALRFILRDGRHPVVGVVTAVDKPAGRHRRLTSGPVKDFAQQEGIPVLQPPRLRDSGFLAELKKWGADCFVVVAFRILPATVFTMPSRGTINLHASRLPAYRGAAPIRWVLFNGEKETGVTTFLIQQKVDTGDLLLSRSLPIGAEENHGELAARLADTGAVLLLESLNLWERKEVKPQKQDLTKVSKAPKITAEDRMISWSLSSQKIFNRVRGLSPSPGAVCRFREKQVKILRCQPVSLSAGEPPRSVSPGETIAADPKTGITVAVSGGALRLTQVQPAGKRPMTGAEFVRGAHVQPGQMWS